MLEVAANHRLLPLVRTALHAWPTRGRDATALLSAHDAYDGTTSARVRLVDLQAKHEDAASAHERLAWGRAGR